VPLARAWYVEAQRCAFPYARKLVSGPFDEGAAAWAELAALQAAGALADCNLSARHVTRKVLPVLSPLQRGAVLAFDDKCRLVLERVVPGAGEPRTAAWLMCNPSDADALRDDPTAGRVVKHSGRADCRRSLVGNVWAWRTPQPSELWMALDDDLYTPAMDSANLDALAMIGAQADVHVVAFGVAPGRMYPDQVRRALGAFTPCGGPLYCLATSDDGWPLHPLARGKLAIPADATLTPWSWP
jgi:hypothetical protein